MLMFPISALQLQEDKYLTSATQEVVKKSRAELIRETGTKLVSVRNTYLQSLDGLIPSRIQSRYCLSFTFRFI